MNINTVNITTQRAKAGVAAGHYDPEAMPFTMESLGNFTINQTVLQVKEKGGYIFAVGQALLTVVDFRNPAAPLQIYKRAYTGNLSGNTLNAPDCLIDGNILYVCSRRSSGYGSATTKGKLLYSVLSSFDISKPEAVKPLQDLIYTWNKDDGGPLITAMDLVQKGAKKYIVGAGNVYFGGGTAIIDVSDPSNMKKVSFVKNTDTNPANQPHGVCVVNENLAVLGNYNAACIIRGMGLDDPAAPTFGAYVGRTGFTATNAWRIRHLEEGLVLAAHGSGSGSAFGAASNGLSISDFNNPAAPKLVSQFVTPKGSLSTLATADWPHVQCEWVKSPGGKLYALLDNAVLGVYLVNITDKAAPVGLGNIRPDAEVKGVRTFAFSEDRTRLYMADGPYPRTAAGKAVYCMHLNWKW